MANKTIKRVLVITVVLLGLVGGGLWLFSDNTQYVEIGTTGYYLVEPLVDGKNTCPDIRRMRDGYFSEPMKLSGTPKVIYWNENYIVALCNDKITSYCLIDIKADGAQKTYKFDSQEQMLKAFNLELTSMKSMDATIPWRPHI